MKEITCTKHFKPTKNSCLRRMREKSRQNDIKRNVEKNRKFWSDI